MLQAIAKAREYFNNKEAREQERAEDLLLELKSLCEYEKLSPEAFKVRKEAIKELADELDGVQLSRRMFLIYSAATNYLTQMIKPDKRTRETAALVSSFVTWTPADVERLSELTANPYFKEHGLQEAAAFVAEYGVPEDAK